MGEARRVIGFMPGNRNRRPIYGVRTGGKIGYAERDEQGNEWFCGPDGRRVAKVLRFKCEAPEVSANLCGGTIITLEDLE